MSQSGHPAAAGPLVFGRTIPDMSDRQVPTPPAGAVPLAGFAAQRAAAADIAASVRARLELLLAPQDLRIYASGAFVEALRQRVRAQRRMQVRLLLPEGLSGHSAGAPLWRLAQDLPSYVAVRVRAEPPQGDESAWLLADRGTLLYRAYPAGADGEYDADAPARVRALRERFEALWNEATPDPNARRLAL